MQKETRSLLRVPQERRRLLFYHRHTDVHAHIFRSSTPLIIPLKIVAPLVDDAGKTAFFLAGSCTVRQLHLIEFSGYMQFLDR